MKSTILFLYFLCICMFSNAQGTRNGLVFVDTVEISEPVYVLFEEVIDSYIVNVQGVLVSENWLDTLDHNYTNFKDFLLAEGYLLFIANEFSCFIDNHLNGSDDVRDTVFYDQLKDSLWKAMHDTVWIYNGDDDDGSFEIYNGWQYSHISPKKFLFFLVKGGCLDQCRAISDIRIEDMDNVYFPVLVPITW